MPDPLVLVAHESDALRREILAALGGAGLLLEAACDGDEALRGLLRRHPAVMVVDVGISGRAAFELCDVIEEAGLRTRVLLVASVYNRTRYKRRPTSLYGADDYVEQHHIHDMLRPKVERLVGRAVPPPRHGEVDPVSARRLQEAGDQMLTIHFASLEEGRSRAQRLCELLVADMALYAGDEVAVVVAGHGIPERLSEDIEEARRIFQQRVPPEVRGGEDWIDRAFTALVAARRRGRARSGAARALSPSDSQEDAAEAGDDRA